MATEPVQCKNDNENQYKNKEFVQGFDLKEIMKTTVYDDISGACTKTLNKTKYAEQECAFAEQECAFAEQEMRLLSKISVMFNVWFNVLATKHPHE